MKTRVRRRNRENIIFESLDKIGMEKLALGAILRWQIKARKRNKRSADARKTFLPPNFIIVALLPMNRIFLMIRFRVYQSLSKLAEVKKKTPIILSLIHI